MNVNYILIIIYKMASLLALMNRAVSYFKESKSGTMERIVKYQLMMSLIAKSVEVVLMECQQMIMRLFHMKILPSNHVIFANALFILMNIIMNVRDVIIAVY
jgi:hypothetical protein